MADNKKNAMREIPKHDFHVDSNSEDHSLFKDLTKYAYEEHIRPRTTSLVRDFIDGSIRMFADALSNAVDRALYPNGGAPARKSNSSNSGVYTGVTRYDSFSRPINQNNNNDQYRSNSGRDTIGQRPGNEVRYIWVESEEKAKKVTNTLKEEIDNYGKAKVASLYEMTKQRTTMADFNFGWTVDHLNQIKYFYDSSRKPGEYKWFLDLPCPVDITNV